MKGTKSIWKHKIGKRYQGPDIQVLMGSFPDQWHPEAVILDGMFFLNCKPLRNIKTVKEYGIFLYDRFLLPHYQALVSEIHLLFDTPGSDMNFNPKLFEQNRRDGKKEGSSHNHISFTPSTSTEISWRSHIDCRQCKASLVQALGLSFLQTIRQQLRPGQKLYLSGCFPQNIGNHVYMFSGGALPLPVYEYNSDSNEADMRIWKHAFETQATRILIYSPDTDIYNIGLPLLSEIPNKEVIVQYNVLHSPICSYLHINNLIKALELDPDLASLPHFHLPKIFQMLFICSGCDYLSYFHGQGKTAFLNAFFQHAQFITGKHADGLLCDISEDKREKGFLSFLRLVGTLYFKKHFSAMVSLKNVETPQQLLQSHEESCSKEKHIAWYNTIRGIVSERISDERDRDHHIHQCGGTGSAVVG